MLRPLQAAVIESPISRLNVFVPFQGVDFLPLDAIDRCNSTRCCLQVISGLLPEIGSRITVPLRISPLAMTCNRNVLGFMLTLLIDGNMLFARLFLFSDPATPRHPFLPQYPFPSSYSFPSPLPSPSRYPFPSHRPLPNALRSTSHDLPAPLHCRATRHSA
jgi:hypothetical protein